MMVIKEEVSHTDDNILDKERGNACRCYETQNNLLHALAATLHIMSAK